MRYAARDLALEGLTLQARDLSTLELRAYEAAARVAGGGQIARAARGSSR